MKKLNFLVYAFLLTFVFACDVDEEATNYDISKPTISSISADATGRNAEFTLSASISDESGLYAVKLYNSEWGLDTTMTINGAAYQLSYSVFVPSTADLSKRNVIEITAWDAKRNESMAHAVVNFGNDTENPTVTLDEASVKAFPSADLEATIMVADNIALTEIMISAEDWSKTYITNGADKFNIILNPTNGTFTLPSSGTVIVKVTAKDASGNVATQDLTLNVADAPVYQTIGIIGSATASGWDASTAMTQDPNDPYSWFILATLTDGEMKFRANDAWDVNWGGVDGVGELNGANIAVTAGTYLIRFNNQTTAYSISAVETYSTVGIIGSATASGWDASTAMIQGADVHSWWIITKLIAGEVKFRANDAWDVNWGAKGTSGIATVNGDNIAIAEEGYYRLELNSATGIFSITKIEVVEYQTVGIIGSATPNDWNASTPLTQDPNDKHSWSGTVTLTNGEAKFRANDAWTANWGGTSFPSGYGVKDGANIPVTAGTYVITFHDITGKYTFTKQ